MGFQAREVAREMARRIKHPMDRIRAQDAEIGDQVRRAVISVVLNLSEASRRIGRDRRNRYRYASGSAAEVRSAIELAVDWSFVTDDEVREVLGLLDRVLAMLWRLEHPRPSRVLEDVTRRELPVVSNSRPTSRCGA